MDVHILEVAKQMGVNIYNEIHLISYNLIVFTITIYIFEVFIAEFIRMKDKLDQENIWIFRKNTLSINFFIS